MLRRLEESSLGKQGARCGRFCGYEKLDTWWLGCEELVKIYIGQWRRYDVGKMI